MGKALKLRKNLMPYGSVGSCFAIGILILCSLFVLVPLVWLFFSSFKTTQEILVDATVLPKQWILDNYILAWTQVALGKAMLNSFIISSISTFGTILVASMASYILSRYEFKGKNIILGVVMAGLLVPSQSIFVPAIFIQKTLKLYDTMLGLILVYITLNLPIAIFVLRSFINTIPKEIEEAAIIDGCGFIAKFFKVILPLLVPGLVTVGTITFLACWAEFLFAFNLTSSASIRTLQISLAFFRGQFLSNYGAQYAGIMMSIVPSLILFLLFQERIMKGLVAGSIKG